MPVSTMQELVLHHSLLHLSCFSSDTTLGKDGASGRK